MVPYRRLPPLHVEATVHPSCPTPLPLIRNEIQQIITSQSHFQNGPIDTSSSKLLQSCCTSVEIADIDEDEYVTDSSSISEIFVHTFILSDEDVEIEELVTDNDDDEADLAASETLPLPHQSLHKSWDHLILPSHIKTNLLEYASSALLFSDKRVSEHVISWNRLILLHGPPGTGKTSLCRALAHKLAFRMSHRFDHASLLEIHSHSLFSKWFSESGKLVARLFGRIKDMVEEEENALICVLIDEVESLAAIRSSDGGAAGSDAVRAVNALLTAIDRLRRFKNVIVLTTTNITGSVDLAFVDRADVKIYIGLPNLEARYEILRSCAEELVRVGIISVEDGCELLSYRRVGKSLNWGIESDVMSFLASETKGECIQENEPADKNDSLQRYEFETMLLRCAMKAKGLSGRSLRKLPFQTHAMFVRTSSVSMSEFLSALARGVDTEQESRLKMNGDGLNK